MNNTYNEKEIVVLLQDPARQREAFARIVKEYSEQLYWQIRRLVLSHDDANDILQNTFIKAWTNIEYFRGDAKMSTWLYRIALNECLTFLNKQRASQQLSIDEADTEIMNQLESDTYFDGDETQKALALLPVNSFSQPGRKAVPGDLFSEAVFSSWGGPRGPNSQGKVKPHVQVSTL